MEFSQYDLGHLAGGEAVEVTLSCQANVRLMDAHNFALFKSGRAHRCVGGLVKQSPVQLRVPGAGHWYVTVDLGGYRGSVRFSARVLR